MEFKDIKAVYFIGAGGIGMSAIARYFIKKGLVVGGYDKTPSELTRRLEKKDDLARQLSARIHRLESLIRQASGLIDQYTSEQEKKILQLRYLEGYEWLQVSNEVRKITPKQLRNIARKGLAKIVLPEDAIWIRNRIRAA